MIHFASFIIIGALQLVSGQERRLCSPDVAGPSSGIQQAGVCLHTKELDEYCKDLEVKQSARDCASVEGNWCCYVPHKNTKYAMGRDLISNDYEILEHILKMISKSSDQRTNMKHSKTIKTAIVTEAPIRTEPSVTDEIVTESVSPTSSPLVQSSATSTIASKSSSATVKALIKSNETSTLSIALPPVDHVLEVTNITVEMKDGLNQVTLNSTKEIRLETIGSVKSNLSSFVATATTSKIQVPTQPEQRNLTTASTITTLANTNVSSPQKLAVAAANSVFAREMKNMDGGITLKDIMNSSALSLAVKRSPLSIAKRMEVLRLIQKLISNQSEIIAKNEPLSVGQEKSQSHNGERALAKSVADIISVALGQQVISKPSAINVSSSATDLTTLKSNTATTAPDLSTPKVFENVTDRTVHGKDRLSVVKNDPLTIKSSTESKGLSVEVLINGSDSSFNATDIKPSVPIVNSNHSVDITNSTMMPVPPVETAVSEKKPVKLVLPIALTAASVVESTSTSTLNATAKLALQLSTEAPGSSMSGIVTSTAQSETVNKSHNERENITSQITSTEKTVKFSSSLDPSSLSAVIRNSSNAFVTKLVVEPLNELAVNESVTTVKPVLIQIVTSKIGPVTGSVSEAANTTTEVKEPIAAIVGLAAQVKSDLIQAAILVKSPAIQNVTASSEIFSLSSNGNMVNKSEVIVVQKSIEAESTNGKQLKSASSALLTAKLSQPLQKNCTPDGRKSSDITGQCVSTQDLDEKCSDKDVLASKQDCVTFDGSWCCFDRSDATNHVEPGMTISKAWANIQMFMKTISRI